jgi:hypothetical protein
MGRLFPNMALNAALYFKRSVMKSVTQAMFVLLISVFTGAVNAADPGEIEKKVAALNLQSIKSLGVSLNALRYLVDANPNNYLLLSHLEQSGEITFIRELELKGYVRTQKVKALPDGTQTNQTFLRIIPLGAGAELQRCMVALKHNSDSQPTR